MSCYTTVLYVACALLSGLPGSGKPDCDKSKGEKVVVLAKVQGELPELEGIFYEVEPERKTDASCSHAIEIIPIESRYPNCVAGNVRKDPVSTEEGVIPGEQPYQGVCCAPGCKGAEGKSFEYIPFGVPMGYAAERAKRHE